MEIYEEWKPLDFMGYSKYEISNIGRLKTIKTGYITVGSLNKCGFLLLNIRHDDGKKKKPNMHLLVARAFLGNPPYSESNVVHMDGNKQNNKVSNLKWYTKNTVLAKYNKFGNNTPQVPIIDNLIWKSIANLNYPNYAVSNTGLVINLTTGYLTPGSIRLDGYQMIKLVDNKGTQQPELIHRIIAKAFLGIPDDKLELTVDHIDRNKSNNHISNLRWATKSEQRINQIRPTFKRSNKPITQILPNGQQLFTWFNLGDASTALNINIVKLREACRNNSFIDGFYWKYALELIPGEEWRYLPTNEFKHLVGVSSFGRIYRNDPE